MRSIDLHQVSCIIRDALPWLSFRTNAIVDALVLTGGPVGTADRVARRLGFSNRFGLARLLRKDGLPPLHRLSGYMSVLHWVWLWERDNLSLARSALREDREPAAAYRLVKQTTGATWTAVRTAGFDRVLSQFLEECAGSELRELGKSGAVVA